MNIKTAFFASTFLFISNTLLAQPPIIIDCNYRTYCEYNPYLEAYKNCDGYDEYSRFEFNQEEDLFIHFTENMVSYYYIKQSNYDSENDILNLIVTSDAGNEYEYQIDNNNNKIRAYFLNTGYEHLRVEFKMDKN